MKRIYLTLIVGLLLIGVVVAGEIISANMVIKVDKAVKENLVVKGVNDIEVGKTFCINQICYADIKNNKESLGFIYFKNNESEEIVTSNREIALKRFLEEYSLKEKPSNKIITKLNETKVTLTDK